MSVGPGAVLRDCVIGARRPDRRPRPRRPRRRPRVRRRRPRPRHARPLRTAGRRLLTGRGPVTHRARLTLHESRADPKLLDRRPHRSRQVDAGRPAAVADRDDGRQEGGRPGPRLDGPGARARHHHQGAHGPAALSRARRPGLHAQPHRHAGPRRLLLRGLARAGRLRGRHPHRRRRPGHRGPDAGQLLPGLRRGPDHRPGHQQDRPAGGRPRGHARADHRAARPRRRRGAGDLGQARHRRARGAGGDHRPHPAADRRRRRRR